MALEVGGGGRDALKVAGTPIGVHLGFMRGDKESWAIVPSRNWCGDFYVTGTVILTRANTVRSRISCTNTHNIANGLKTCIPRIIMRPSEWLIR